MRQPNPSRKDIDLVWVRRSLSELQATESLRPLRLEEQIDRAHLLRIDPETSTDGLALAKEIYRAALRQHDEYVPALVGLAWFHYAVEGDAKAAMPLFQRAIRLIKADLAEAVAGAAGCVGDLKSEGAARDFLLAQIRREALDPEEIPRAQRRRLLRRSA